MRCYKVQVTDDLGTTHQAFAGTGALVKQQRDEYATSLGVKKSDVEVTPIDVPLAKAELLSYMNQLLQGSIPESVVKEKKNETKSKSKPTTGKIVKAAATKAGSRGSSKKK